MIDPMTPEGEALAVQVYQRTTYLMDEGFSEDEALQIAGREFDLQ